MRRRSLAFALPVLLVAACATQTTAPVTTVFFTEDSAALDADAQAVVKQAARRAAAATGPVTVAGFAGPVGGLAYNRALSEARAQHVADQLAAEGVARSRIRIVPRGPVPYEAMPTESRRVEIRIGS